MKLLEESMEIVKTNTNLIRTKLKEDPIYGGIDKLTPATRKKILQTANEKLKLLNGEYLFVISKNRYIKQYGVNTGQESGSKSGNQNSSDIKYY